MLDYTSHIWNNLFVAIVSVDLPKNKSRVKKLQAHLKRNKLCPGYIFYGQKAITPKERNNLVFNVHYDIGKWFMKHRPCKHLFILEDDAYVCQKNVSQKIKQTLRYIDKHEPKWFVLNLGCISSKLLIHVAKDIYHGSGYASHSYILNGETLGKYLQDIPRKKWRAPNCVESWNSIPKKHTYMLHPMLFTQDVHFSGIIYLLFPGINNSHILCHYINTINRLNIYRWFIPIIILFYIVIRFRSNLTRLNIL